MEWKEERKKLKDGTEGWNGRKGEIEGRRKEIEGRH